MNPPAAINHQAAVELELAKLHYDEMTEQWPTILQTLENAIDNGITLEAVQGWVIGMEIEERLTRKLCNAARWYAGSRG